MMSQRKIHIAGEIAALAVVVPFCVYLATRSRKQLPTWARITAGAIGAGTLFIDGYLLTRTLRQLPAPVKTAQIWLRSTPSLAIVSVDGERLGTTPLLWEVAVDGRAHDVVFALAGWKPARHRVTPTDDGRVTHLHATLVEEPPTGAGWP